MRADRCSGMGLGLVTWFKVDDSFYSHPKVMMTSPGALGLWVVAGTWSAANLTDGFVSVQALPRLLPDSAELAEELVTVGLWRRAKGGYQFHDWTDYQPTKKQVEEERRKWAEKKAKQRAAKASQDQMSPGDTQGDSRGDSSEESRSSRTRTRVPKGTSSGAAKPRKQDPIWDALMAACGVDTSQIPEDSRGAYNRAVKQLKEIKATPGQITLRAKRYRDKWTTASLTPTALVRRWPELDTSTAPPPESEAERCPRHKRQPKNHCQICDSERRGAA